MKWGQFMGFMKEIGENFLVDWKEMDLGLLTNVS